MGCDVILTSNSYDDDELKQPLGRLLWGYPHLVEIVFSEYSDVRRRNIEQRRTRQNVREAVLAESEKEAPPPQLSEPSTEVWAHAKTEDVSSEYMTQFVTQGPGWYALFNPDLERLLDVSLVHSHAHDRCVYFTASTAWINDILFCHIFQCRELCTLLP